MRKLLNLSWHGFGSSTAAVTILTAAAFGVMCPAMSKAQNDRTPDVPSPQCDSIELPAGNKVAFHAYAIGVQIYRWSGIAWVFVAPAADLYANAGCNGQVGIHYAGPTWESNSGSKVVGSKIQACTPDPTAIPWLLLEKVTSKGPGIFHGITYVQRLNTVGGIAPTAAGSFVGELQSVPYAAEYYFYRADEGE